MNILIAALLLSAQESRPPETTVQGFKLPDGFSAKLFVPKGVCSIMVCAPGGYLGSS